jgi:cyanate permease
LICFSLFGLLAHNVAEKIDFEKSLLMAMLAVFVGTVLRAFSSEIWTFAACTVVAGRRNGPSDGCQFLQLRWKC